MSKEILSTDPYVAVHNNFLTNKECKHFISEFSGSLKRALVSNEFEGVESKGRTGSNTWIKHDHDEITLAVAKKIAKTVGMPLENAESFQMIYYGVSEEYRKHYDSWNNDGSEKSQRCMKWGGARMKTALCYLNTVKEGGGTEMSKLDITIQAEKGKMLVFQNTISEEDKNRHPLSEHAGLPVIQGEKYAFNLWFREQNVKKEYFTLPNTLQIGDYIPFIKIKCMERIKDIHNFCNDKPFAFITLRNVNEIHINQNIIDNFNLIVLFEEGIPYKQDNVLYSQDKQLYKLFDICDQIKMYISDPNRRIVSIVVSDKIQNILNDIKIENYLTKYAHIPYLLIENALDDNLLKKIINFYNRNKIDGNLISHQNDTKDRLHIHPDKELEKEIDHKLSRSVLPELRKVFYFDAEYRETYKICSYDAETSGRFHPHRDTPAPYQHRKYALSLFLNDDYEGGEFVLPEYGLKIKPKANTAFIFPGINTHQVLPVTKGSRMTIITFFVNGTTKPQYKMKAHFYKDKNIVDSQIYPK